MASIIRRRNKFSVAYRYVDTEGKERQRWESFDRIKDAKIRKSEIEDEKNRGVFVVPTVETLDELWKEYTKTYGVNSWAMSTYESRQSLYNHYVSPLIGDKKITDFNTRMMDQYFHQLRKVRSISSKTLKPKHEFISPHTINEVRKMLRSVFHQAMKWELIGKNPVDNVTIPKVEHAKRDIWTAETLFHAIDVCEDDTLKLAMNIAFACTLRMGELLGLTWDCIDISPKSIEEGNSFLYIDKELQRVSREAMEKLDDKGIKLKFDPILKSNTTILVLKEPKTSSSVRRVYIPKTVVKMLQDRKDSQKKLMEFLGDEYTDYNLVFTTPSGRPVEPAYINKALKRLIKDNDLPKVVFHSIRHSSITYKLKLNGGDIKSVQGDSGHSQMKMVEDVYSHVIDEDRKRNAEKIEDAFYSGKETKDKAEDENKRDVNAVKADPNQDTINVLMKLMQNPEMTQALKQLAESANAK